MCFKDKFEFKNTDKNKFHFYDTNYDNNFKPKIAIYNSKTPGYVENCTASIQVPNARIRRKCQIYNDGFVNELQKKIQIDRKPLLRVYMVFFPLLRFPTIEKTTIEIQKLSPRCKAKSIVYRKISPTMTATRYVKQDFSTEKKTHTHTPPSETNAFLGPFGMQNLYYFSIYLYV